MKGKNFLKVTGILMIIFAIIGLIGCIIILAGGALLSGAAKTTDAATGEAVKVVGTAVIVASIIGMLGYVVELIAGIFGVKYCKTAEKAGTCLVWGIIVLVLEVISVALSISGSSSASSIIITIIAGLAIPVLYVIGACLNKKSEQ